MKILTTVVARVLFALPFLVFGLMHVAAGQNMAMMIPSFLPGGVLWVYLTGVALIAGGLSLIINKLAKEALIGLSVFLIAVVATVHVPGVSNPDPMMQQIAMSGLLKDIGLLGGALAYLGSYSK
ncbi:MAG: DoxX family protein [Bacteroidetes bacterium]|nr:DoxX family protein [Bacteroidota bacterium]